MTQLNIGGWPNLSIASLPAETGSFTIPVVPASSAATRVALSPIFSAGPTGLDPYRPWSVAVIDGEIFATNGWDTPRRWDRTLNIWAAMGSVAPATFALALSAAGAPAAIPTGQTARYYLVFYNSTLDKETAMQGGGDVTIANATGATRDVTVTWTAAEAPADYDYVRIYRALNLTDDYKRVNGATGTAIASATFLDVTPDATLLLLSDSYTWDGATRTTLPENFLGIFEADGRLWGWTRGSDILRYSDGVRATGVYLADHFASQNLIQIGFDEGTGGIVNVVGYHGSKVVWKRKAIYELVGDDNVTADVRCTSPARGTFNPRTVVPVDRWFICLDELGVYKLTPGLYAGVVGSAQDIYRAPMQPIIDRMNLSASHTFWAQHLNAQGIVIFWVALDFDPTPGHGIIFDYATGTFGGLITMRAPTCGGYLRDANGARHPVFGDDLGYLWEDLYAQSEGCFSGDNTASVTSSATNRVLTCSGAAFATTLQGATGTPLERYSSAGVVVDTNRVYSVTSTVITTLLYPTTAYASGDTLAVGVIPAVFETGFLDFGTHEMKWVRDVFIEYESGVVDGSVRIDSSVDDEDFVLKWEQDTEADIWAWVPTKNVVSTNADRGRRWRLRLSQRYANLGFSIRTLTLHWDVVPGSKLPGAR